MLRTWATLKGTAGVEHAAASPVHACSSCSSSCAAAGAASHAATSNRLGACPYALLPQLLPPHHVRLTALMLQLYDCALMLWQHEKREEQRGGAGGTRTRGPG
eukprot:159877-Rhodomonas_salina.4